MSAEAVAMFLRAMEAAGVRPVEPIAQALCAGALIRFRCEGDGPGKRNGWAVLHLDGRPAGEFGWYKGGVRERWRSGRQEPISDAERRRLRSEWAEARARRERERAAAWEAAASEAEGLWCAASAASPAHPYLERKALQGEGLRQQDRALLVPMRDLSGKIWNVQRIYPDGFKKFLKGGRTRGLMCVIGKGGRKVCIGEGWATMAAIHEATRITAIATFSGENLEPVARAVRARWQRLDIVICADNDAHLVDHPQIRKNLGVEYARAAAAAVRGRLAIPREAR